MCLRFLTNHVRPGVRPVSSLTVSNLELPVRPCTARARPLKFSRGVEDMATVATGHRL